MSRRGRAAGAERVAGRRRRSGPSPAGAPIPASAWSRLVLPLPLGPTRQASSPGLERQRRRSQPARACARPSASSRRHALQPPAHVGDQPQEEGRAEQGGDHADRQRPAERREPADEVGERSAAARRSAPPAGSPGRDGRAVSRRAKIGATRPMKPIAPQIATQAPTPSAVRQTTCSRSRADVVAERLRRLPRRARGGRAPGAAAAAGRWPAAPASAAKAAWARLRSTSEPISQS